MHVPYVAPGAMTEIMAQPSNGDKIDVVVSDLQSRLLSLQVSNLLFRKVRDTCIRCNATQHIHHAARVDRRVCVRVELLDMIHSFYAPRQCSNRLWEAAGQT